MFVAIGHNPAGQHLLGLEEVVEVRP